MAINFPGPYEIRLFYTVDGTPGGPLQHEQRLNIDVAGTPTPGSAFVDISVNTSEALTVDLDVVVEEWITTLAPLFSSGVSFDFVELWHYPTPQSFDANFVSTYQPTANSGSSGSSTQLASQGIYTFRTIEGGIMKVSLMEQVHAPNVRESYSDLTAARQALVDYVLGGGAIAGARFLGRDTSYPFAFIAYFPGQNEAIFKNRYR